MVYKTRKYGLIQELPSTPDRKTGSLVKSVGLDSEDYFSDELEFSNQKGDVTVVVPTLNEEGNIGDAIGQLRYTGFSDILVVDGYSSDRTVELAKRLGAFVVFQKGRGKGDALRHAFGLEGVGDRVVMMDADGSMDPKEIYSFLEPLAGGADVVKGSRFMRGGYSEDISLVRRLGNGFFVFLVNRLFGTGYTDLCYGYAVFKKDALRLLSPGLKSTGFEIETELFIKAKKLGLKVVEVPSVERARKNGNSNLRALRDGLRILTTIFQEALN